MDTSIDTTAPYDGAFITNNPTKIELLLNQILHKPNSALIIEPFHNEFWIFYYGGASYPEEDKDLKHYKSNGKKSIQSDTTTNLNQWASKIIKVDDDSIVFFEDIISVLNSIRNKETIKIATETPDKNKKLHIFYRN